MVGNEKRIRRLEGIIGEPQEEEPWKAIFRAKYDEYLEARERWIEKGKQFPNEAALEEVYGEDFDEVYMGLFSEQILRISKKGGETPFITRCEESSK